MSKEGISVSQTSLVCEEFIFAGPCRKHHSQNTCIKSLILLFLCWEIASNTRLNRAFTKLCSQDLSCLNNITMHVLSTAVK
jgi:hypothetical protein